MSIEVENNSIKEHSFAGSEENSIIREYSSEIAQNVKENEDNYRIDYGCMENRNDVNPR